MVAKYSYIDRSGKTVIDASRYESAAVSEGLNPTQTEESKFVYIDRTGKIVLATEFFYAGQFHDGLTVVYNDETNRWGFIDTTGEVAIPGTGSV